MGMWIYHSKLPKLAEISSQDLRSSVMISDLETTTTTTFFFWNLPKSPWGPFHGHVVRSRGAEMTPLPHHGHVVICDLQACPSSRTGSTPMELLIGMVWHG
jgi:hypothetical protein